MLLAQDLPSDRAASDRKAARHKQKTQPERYGQSIPEQDAEEGGERRENRADSVDKRVEYLKEGAGQTELEWSAVVLEQRHLKVCLRDGGEQAFELAFGASHFFVCLRDVLFERDSVT